MPKSCKCILDRMVFKGAMTKEERDKIVRNLKTQNEGRKTMGKLIDVDAFKARLSAGLVYQGADVLEALDEQPTIEERKTGRWIGIAEYCKKNNLIPIGTEIFWWCSECNHPIANDYHRTAKFCPRCGAKMEGAEE